MTDATGMQYVVAPSRVVQPLLASVLKCDSSGISLMLGR